MRDRLLGWHLGSAAGFIDAVGFLYLGGVFLSFMSGNTTHLAANVTQGFWGSVGETISIIVLFVIGVFIGALIRRRWDQRALYLFLCLTALAASVFVVVGVGSGAMMCLSFTVGAMNNMFLRNGTVSIPLTYVTGTLVKTAQCLADAVLGGNRLRWIIPLVQWLSLLCGALAGAACYRWLGLHSVWIVTAWIAAAGLLLPGRAPE